MKRRNRNNLTTRYTADGMYASDGKYLPLVREFIIILVMNGTIEGESYGK